MIERSTRIAEILEQSPEKASILLAQGMHCVGCPSAQSESIEDACIKHDIDIDEMLEKLNA
ncbi:MAG: DUF1858 domain-containing protein [Oscillospiraceae bacterium]|nr:DUF1858 domain-containing protein [Oscillospiraceae bacterium]